MSYDGIPCSATLKVPARTAYFSIGRHLEIELCGSKWISQALCAAFATLRSTSKSISRLTDLLRKRGVGTSTRTGPIPPVPPLRWPGRGRRCAPDGSKRHPMRTAPQDLHSDNRRDYPPDLRVVVA